MHCEWRLWSLNISCIYKLRWWCNTRISRTSPIRYDTSVIFCIDSWSWIITSCTTSTLSSLLLLILCNALCLSGSLLRLNSWSISLVFINCWLTWTALASTTSFLLPLSDEIFKFLIIHIKWSQRFFISFSWSFNE
jgi:hypothetical protein